MGGATLTLSGGASRTATSAASGSYSFTDLVPGAYVVTIAPPAGFELGAGEVAAKNATVTAGQSATVNFALAAVSGGNVQVINVSGITFSPASVTIARGTTVRWVNGTTVFHTVTPDGNTEWTSANLGAGTQFEHTFNTAGTFNYFCTPHHSLGMTGTIIVQ